LKRGEPRDATLQTRSIVLEYTSTARKTPAAPSPLDDVLDAGAAAWSAQRIALGIAETLPGPPEHVDGMNLCIWY